MNRRHTDLPSARLCWLTGEQRPYVSASADRRCVSVRFDALECGSAQHVYCTRASIGVANILWMSGAGRRAFFFASRSTRPPQDVPATSLARSTLSGGRRLPETAKSRQKTRMDVLGEVELCGSATNSGVNTAMYDADGDGAGAFGSPWRSSRFRAAFSRFLRSRFLNSRSRACPDGFFRFDMNPRLR